jgi:hypothetical protein
LSFARDVLLESFLWLKYTGSLLKSVSVNFFCLMKSIKKCDASHVVSQLSSDGGSGMANRDLSVRIAAFCLPELRRNNEIKIALSALKSEFLRGRLTPL